MISTIKEIIILIIIIIIIIIIFYYYYCKNLENDLRTVMFCIKEH